MQKEVNLKDIILAKRYALAALQCIKQEDYQKTSDETFELRKMFKSIPDLGKYFTSSVIHKQQKQDFIQSIFSDFYNREFWESIFTVFIIKNRGNLIELFLKTFDLLLIEALDQTHIDLILAHEQDNETVGLIDQEVERILGCKVITDVTIDKEIIGGFIALAKNQIIDASVRSQLRRFARKSTPSIVKSDIPPAVGKVAIKK